jgi:predicted Abi (CAAX) family protease
MMCLVRTTPGAGGGGVLSVLDASSICCDANEKDYVTQQGIRKRNRSHKWLFWSEVHVIACRQSRLDRCHRDARGLLRNGCAQTQAKKE